MYAIVRFVFATMGHRGFEPRSSGPKPERLTRLPQCPLHFKKELRAFINYFFSAGLAAVGLASVLAGVIVAVAAAVALAAVGVVPAAA